VTSFDKSSFFISEMSNYSTQKNLYENGFCSSVIRYLISKFFIPSWFRRMSDRRAD